MAIDDKLRITRDQYSKFIDDHDTIKQFERLLEYVNTFVVPGETTEETIQGLAHPIGEIYIQYPGKEAPNDLFLGQTWANVSDDFAGDFFRAEGGTALDFEDGEQTGTISKHTHSTVLGSHSHGFTNDIGGGSQVIAIAAGSGTSAEGIIASKNLGTKTSGDPNSSTDVDDETRPVNQTIRVWERTA